MKNRLGASLIALAFLSFPCVDLACAQAIERHQPLLEAERRAPIIEPDAVPMDEDDTPIGPELKSLAILSGDQSVKTTLVDGVDVSSVARLVATKAAIEADLNPFIGRPISRKLIAQVEEVIARRYRRLGFPFVSLSTPEQKISDGALQVRVLEFSIGKLLTSKLPTGSIQNVIDQVGLKPGDAIDAPRLGKDLAWLNRYPFSSIQAVFTPSQTPGGADLILSAQSSKPWRLYLGYDNSGSPSSTLDRYFAGGAVGDLLGRDSVVSLQLTSSRDAFAGVEHPNYASEAISYSVPVFKDVQIEASFDHIEANQTSGDFLFRLKANEGALAIRFLAPFEFSASTQSDIRLGLSVKQQENLTLFGGENASSLSAEEYGLLVGWHIQQQSYDAYFVGDLAIHASVDDADAGSQSQTNPQATGGRASYAYATLFLEHAQPISRYVRWKAQVSGQWSRQMLPRMDQTGLGGPTLVRGYSLDSGSFDSSLIVRNELHLTCPQSSCANTNLFAFYDAGLGWYGQHNPATQLTSVGVGAGQSILDGSTLDLTIARLLASGPAARAGDWKAAVSVSFRY